jgi:hypothetical protein
MVRKPRAPGLLGDVFLSLIRDRRAKEFQALLMENDYDWSHYWSGFSPEEAQWVFMNRPTAADRERRAS